jgi:hypothetical protein
MIFITIYITFYMSDDLYNVKNYTDQQLYDILDMNNPTDR